MKHCDLPAILARVDSLQGGNGSASTLLYHDVPAMAAELAAWRDLGAALIAGAQGAHDSDRDASRATARGVIYRMRALVPPTKED